MEEENIQNLAKYITKKCQIGEYEMEQEGCAVTTNLSRKQNVGEYR